VGGCRYTTQMCSAILALHEPHSQFKTTLPKICIEQLLEANTHCRNV
jgi:hypothetical protein